MELEIKAVIHPTELETFIHFPFQLYKNNPFWVPPLKASETAWLSPTKNPAFQHAEVILLSAWRNGEMVGRIAGIINELESKQLGHVHARFGWLDFIDDKAVSILLLESVEKWAKSKGAIRLKGPYGFNSLDKNGMLVEGFEELGAMTTLYNFAYYPQHIEELGYQKELEWIEMKAVLPPKMPDKITVAASKIMERYHLKVKQPKNKVELLRFGHQVFDMLQATYQHLPTYVPISAEQQDFYIKNYIGLLPPKFLCMVEHEGEGPIGFGLTMPNMSKAMQRANGKLFPLGFIPILLAQYFNNSGVLTLIGVKEEWRRRGIHSLIFKELGDTFIKMGFNTFDVNPMLDDNTNVLALWKEFDHYIHKRRRTYFKDLV